MELQQLRYFLAVVEEKNINRAARILRISQPALSRQLQRLEDELNGVLFDRTPSGIVLTENGYYLAERAREMVTLADKIVTNLTTEETLHGDLYIGGGETTSMLSVIRAFHEMHQQHPEVTIRIHSGNGQDILDKLDKGILDFGLVIEPFDVKEYHHLQLATADRWGILTRRDHPLGRQTTVDAADLRNAPLIISEQTKDQQQFAEKTGLDFNASRIVGTYNLLFNASLLVKEGLGHAVCLEHIINTTGSELIFVPLLPNVTSNTFLIWKKEAVLSRPAKKLLEWINDQLQIKKGTDA